MTIHLGFRCLLPLLNFDYCLFGSAQRSFEQSSAQSPSQFGTRSGERPSSLVAADPAGRPRDARRLLVRNGPSGRRPVPPAFGAFLAARRAVAPGDRAAALVQYLLGQAGLERVRYAGGVVVEVSSDFVPGGTGLPEDLAAGRRVPETSVWTKWGTGRKRATPQRGNAVDRGMGHQQCMDNCLRRISIDG